MVVLTFFTHQCLIKSHLKTNKELGMTFYRSFYLSSVIPDEQDLKVDIMKLLCGMWMKYYPISWVSETCKNKSWQKLTE